MSVTFRCLGVRVGDFWAASMGPPGGMLWPMTGGLIPGTQTDVVTDPDPTYYPRGQKYVVVFAVYDPAGVYIPDTVRSKTITLVDGMVISENYGKNWMWIAGGIALAIFLGIVLSKKRK